MNVGCLNDSACPEAAQDPAEEVLDKGANLGSMVRPHDPQILLHMSWVTLVSLRLCLLICEMQIVSIPGS